MLVAAKPNTYPSTATSQKLIQAVKFSNLNRWADRTRTLLHRKCPIVPHQHHAHVTEVVLVSAIADEEEDDPDRV
jgi:hypothetical protein